MRLIAFVGNPNVGKSTLFNALTGMNQHTGNWSGKTVALAKGKCSYKGENYELVDLPGTYSLRGCSPEEKVSEDFLKETCIDCTVIVCDATCLQRGLILALQVIRLCPKSVLCINLIDEAMRSGITVDAHGLRSLLGVPVVLTDANEKASGDMLMDAVRSVCDGFAPTKPWKSDVETPEELIHQAERISHSCVRITQSEKPTLTQRLDAVFLHRKFGYVALLLLLMLIFWLTMKGANYPSQGLQWCFDQFGQVLQRLKLPWFLSGVLIDGIYATVARVVSVMLPPMAIFFPLFTLLEDFGYLPRVAFLLDERFRAVGACGKQSLTMCMGLGCNAVGVCGCRIIDSPRERQIAILTNSFVPCNGRFPGLIFLIGLSFSFGSEWCSAVVLTACILLSVIMTLLASKLLHKTCLRGSASSFILELPPYRRARFLRVVVRSLLDRTLFILGRAVVVAAPVGALIWIFANVHVSGQPLLQVLSAILDTPAKWFGLNGAILLAFLLGSPANELVLPILAMILTCGTTFTDNALENILPLYGWSWRLSLNMIIFFLFHWPCTTTLLTIYKETRSAKQTLLAAMLPTAFGLALCFLLNLII